MRNNTLLLITASLLFTSCFDSSKPNFQYFPDMYESLAGEAYAESDAFSNGIEAQLPVEGTIARGWEPYDYDDTEEGYQLAKAQLISPISKDEINLSKGKELYEIYCSVCHGDKGDGLGILAEREKFLGIPAYNDPSRIITEGSIYHVLMYGRNAMGSHAGQINEEERWQVIQYVLQLKEELK
ncbi:MAG: c-type cytochrome [Candidatus Marisimplicoccus sp.]